MPLILSPESVRRRREGQPGSQPASPEGAYSPPTEPVSRGELTERQKKFGLWGAAQWDRTPPGEIPDPYPENPDKLPYVSKADQLQAFMMRVEKEKAREIEEGLLPGKVGLGAKIAGGIARFGLPIAGAVAGTALAPGPGTAAGYALGAAGGALGGVGGYLANQAITGEEPTLRQGAIDAALGASVGLFPPIRAATIPRAALRGAAESGGIAAATNIAETYPDVEAGDVAKSGLFGAAVGAPLGALAGRMNQMRLAREADLSGKAVAAREALQGGEGYADQIARMQAESGGGISGEFVPPRAPPPRPPVPPTEPLAGGPPLPPLSGPPVPPTEPLRGGPVRVSVEGAAEDVRKVFQGEGLPEGAGAGTYGRGQQPEDLANTMAWRSQLNQMREENRGRLPRPPEPPSAAEPPPAAVAPEPPPSPPEPPRTAPGLRVTPGQQTLLRRLGYSEKQISQMTPDQVERILSEKIKAGSLRNVVENTKKKVESPDILPQAAGPVRSDAPLEAELFRAPVTEVSGGAAKNIQPGVPLREQVPPEQLGVAGRTGRQLNDVLDQTTREATRGEARTRDMEKAARARGEITARGSTVTDAPYFPEAGTPGRFRLDQIGRERLNKLEAELGELQEEWAKADRYTRGERPTMESLIRKKYPELLPKESLKNVNEPEAKQWVKDEGVKEEFPVFDANRPGEKGQRRRRSTEVPEEPSADFGDAKGFVRKPWARTHPNGYEVSTKGDKRYSALNARLKDGRTIEEAYQLDVKGYRKYGNDWRLGKGKPPVDRRKSEEQLYKEYLGLWRQWAKENPEAIGELAEKSRGRPLTDQFARSPISQARALAELIDEQASRGGFGYGSVSRPIPREQARDEAAGQAIRDEAGEQAGLGKVLKRAKDRLQSFAVVSDREKYDVSGMRANGGRSHMNNTEPGQPGWLGNPHKWAGNGGPRNVTKEQAVKAFERDFLQKVENDQAFRKAIFGLRGKRVGYYKPGEEGTHIRVVQEWLRRHGQKGATEPPRTLAGILGRVRGRGAPKPTPPVTQAERETAQSILKTGETAREAAKQREVMLEKAGLPKVEQRGAEEARESLTRPVSDPKKVPTSGPAKQSGFVDRFYRPVEEWGQARKERVARRKTAGVERKLQEIDVTRKKAARHASLTKADAVQKERLYGSYLAGGNATRGQKGEKPMVLSAKDWEQLPNSWQLSPDDNSIIRESKIIRAKAIHEFRDMAAFHRIDHIPTNESIRQGGLIYGDAMAKNGWKEAKDIPIEYLHGMMGRGEVLSESATGAHWMFEQRILADHMRYVNQWMRTKDGKWLALAEDAKYKLAVVTSQRLANGSAAGRALRMHGQLKKFMNPLLKAEWAEQRKIMEDLGVPFNDYLKLISYVYGDERTPANMDAIRMLAVDTSQNFDWKEKVYEFWMNQGLLSGVLTAFANVGGNTVALGLRPLTTMTAATADFLNSSVTGAPRKVHMTEVWADIWGMYNALPRAWEDAMTSWQEEIPMFGGAKVLEAGIERGAIKGPFGRFVRWPGRGLMAMDDFFKSLNYHGKKAQLTYRYAAKNHVGEDRWIAMNRYYRDPNAKYFSEEIEDAIERASVGEAKYRTFTNELGSFMNTLVALKQQPGIPGWSMKIILPFVRTPVNILKMTKDYSPVGLLQVLKKMASKDGGKELFEGENAEKLAAGVIGTMTSLMALYGASQGYITGAGPLDPADKMKQRLGEEPYSIYIGNGRWVSYARADPIAGWLGVAADIYEMWDILHQENALERLTFATTMAPAQSLFSKTWIKGLTDAVLAWSRPDIYGEKYFQSMLGTAVPSTLAQFARASDPYVRDVKGQNLASSLQARIPMASKNLPAFLDVFGREVDRGALGAGPFFGTLIRAINPYPVKRIPPDLPSQEYVRLTRAGHEIHPGTIPGTLRADGLDYELPQELRYEFRKLSGRYWHEAMKRLTGNRMWDSLPDGERGDAVRANHFRRESLRARQRARQEIGRRYRREFPTEMAAARPRAELKAFLERGNVRYAPGE